MLDGVVLSRKTARRAEAPGAGGARHPPRRQEGSARLAAGAGREAPLPGSAPHRSSSTRPAGACLEMIGCRRRSGPAGSAAHRLSRRPVQRCWAHKIRNVLNKVRKPDQGAVKAGLHAVMNADNAGAARSAARRFANRWQALYPKAVACLRNASTSCWPASVTRPSRRARPCAPPTPSNAASEKSGAAPVQWASSRTRPPWTASYSPCSRTKTKTRESLPSSP